MVFQGRLDFASLIARQSLERAEQRQHPNSHILALCGVAHISLLRHDADAAVATCRTALELGFRYDHPTWRGFAKLLLGCALVGQAKLDEGLRMCREGCSDWEDFGAKYFGTTFAAMAADALLNAGCIDEAVQFIEHGENIQKETHETLEAAQLLRLSGRCSEIDREPEAAESKYREAVLIASRQGAWLYALRAATAFASLCESQGRCDDARLVLDPIYKTFSEGFDFPDVRRATEILGRLA